MPKSNKNQASVALPQPTNKRAVFTICSNNYLAFAKTLLNSLEEHQRDCDRFLILADKIAPIPNLYPSNATIICVEGLNLPKFDQFAFRYDVMEFNTAVKPFAILHLIEQLGYSQVIYLDPDIEVFAPLDPITTALDQGASVVLTPHVCHPAEGDIIPGDLQFLQAGTYNLGFCAWNNSKEALSTLRWWARRLEHQCVNEVPRGLFVDQKFIDLVPGFVQHVSIRREPNLNVSYWNLIQRNLESKNGAWLVDDEPLIFFHFSGFAPQKLDALSKHTQMFQGRQISPSLAALMKHYASKLIENGYGKVPSGSYPWAHLANGARIHLSLRKYFREHFGNFIGNPFETFEAALQELSLEDSAGEKLPVSKHMLYLREGLNWLQFLFNPNERDGAIGLADWYIDATGPDWNLDPRLVAPVVATLSERPPLSGAPNADVLRADVSLVGYLKATSGVGEIARRSLKTLTTLPYLIEACDISLHVAAGRQNLEYKKLDVEQVTGRIQIFNINADQITSVLGHIQEDRWLDGYKIAVPFWELDKFPAKFAPDLEGFDELWAPSRHIQSLLYRQFPDKPIIYMPPDLTPRQASNRKRESFGLSPNDFIVFFSFDFLSQIERKNPMGGYDAFKQAFNAPGYEHVKFVLKILNAQYAPSTYQDWHEELCSDPRVILFNEALSSEDMFALIGCANVVLSLHRGEGLGLLISDAIGQMVPVVATDWSGTTDFINRRTGYPVDYKLVPTPVDAYPYVDSHQWAEPDLGHAAWQLLQVYHNPQEAADKAYRARGELIMRFGSGAATAQMKRRIDTILATKDLSHAQATPEAP